MPAGAAPSAARKPRASLDTPAPHCSQLENPFLDLYNMIIKNMKLPGVNRAMKASRHFFVGPENAQNNGKLQLIASKRYLALDNKRSTRTGPQNSFLKVMKLALSGKESNDLDEGPLVLAQFLQELCLAVKASKRTLPPRSYRSLVHELAQYLLDAIFTTSSGNCAKKEFVAKYLKEMNLTFSCRDPGILELTQTALHAFLPLVFGYEKGYPPVRLEWIESLSMFDDLFDPENNLTSAKKKQNELKFRLTRLLLHEGNKPLTLEGNDNFLDHMLEVWGDTGGDGGDDDANDDESIRHIRSLENRHRDLLKSVEDYLANPSEANLSRLPAQIKSKARNLPKASHKDLQDLSEFVLQHLDDPWMVYFAAEEVAELRKDDKLATKAREQLDSYAAKLDVPPEIFESIKDHKKRYYEALRAEHRSSTAATGPLDRIDEVETSSDDEQEDGAADISVSTSSSSDDINGMGVDGSNPYIVDEVHPELYFVDRKHQKLNRLFTPEGIEYTGKVLYSQDRSDNDEFEYDARWACQSGQYLHLDDFTVFKKFGAGSEGPVLAAYYKDPKLGMLVALKLLVIKGQVDYHKYCERSTKKWIELNGFPYILQFLGFTRVDEVDGVPVDLGDDTILMMQVMEVCVATFEEVLEKKQKEVKTADDYNKVYCPFLLDSNLELVEALFPMAVRNIVHRDLKPANLMFGRDKKLKVCDFGLARRKATPFNKNTTGGGTPWYIAPEQDQDRYASSVGPEADTFACGSMLTEAVAFECDITFPERTLEKGLNMNHLKSMKKDLEMKGFHRGVELLDVAVSMCNTDPSKRPTPVQLKQQLLALKEKWGNEDGAEA